MALKPLQPISQELLQFSTNSSSINLIYSMLLLGMTLFVLLFLSQARSEWKNKGGVFVDSVSCQFGMCGVYFQDKQVHRARKECPLFHSLT